MNRAQRRANADVIRQLQQDFLAKPYAERVESLIKAGIFAKDLAHLQITPKEHTKAVQDAWEEGRLAGINGTYQICFAAACLALNDLHKFGSKRCCDVIRRMQEHVISNLCSMEACEEVFRKIGLTLDFGDPQGIAWEDD